MFIRKGKPVGSVNYAELAAAKKVDRQVKAEAKDKVDDAAKAAPAKSTSTTTSGGGPVKADDDKTEAKK